jgi:protein-S-isoprenylcysteine O-methyltransferase Ste14
MATEHIDVFARIVIGTAMVVGGAVGGRTRRKADRVGGRVPRRSDGLPLMIGVAVFGTPSILCVMAFVVAPGLVRWAQVDLPPAVRLAAAPVIVAAIALFLLVFRHLGTNITATSATREKHELVTSGPYRFVRHPFYVSAFLLYAGCAVLAANWFLAVMGAGALTVLALRTGREERNLVAKFGDRYRDYQRRTGRFLPRLRAATPPCGP